MRATNRVFGCGQQAVVASVMENLPINKVQLYRVLAKLLRS